MEPTEIIAVLEKKLAVLKLEFDKYFSGVEKIEPSNLRGEVQKLVRQLSTLYINNTATKFKKDSVIAQYNSYNQYWSRILRQIEEGTYVRDVFKADYRDRIKREVSQPASSTQPKSAEPKKSAVQPGGAGSNNMESVFNNLVNMKKKLGESTANISYDVLSSNLQKQTSAIKKKYNVSRVDFTVEEKDGKAVIKALPKK